MNVPYKWLKSYIDFTFSPEELARRLTMAGMEVEEVEYLGEGLQNIIIGKIEKIEEHPDADKLVICTVNIGKKYMQIVTGAPNVGEGQKVPVAPAGVCLPGGMLIEETTLRGKLSEGMICSEDELGLIDERAEGIMVLDEKAEIGQKFVEYLALDDYVLKLDLTPNYAHCLGILGIAREVQAMLEDKEVKYPENEIVAEIEEDINDLFELEIKAPELCPRYTGMIIKDVKITASPLWMQKRLQAAGIRPINNIVDITNYVLLEYNQPLHAFDLDEFSDNKIIVRRAEQGEELVTLDDKERQLNKNDLVIADNEGAIALAGVMGGANTEVTDKTVNIFLESAYFNPVSIRKTSRRLGIPSEASYRFERGVDIKNLISAAKRAAYLMNKYADGKVMTGVLDCYPHPYEEKIIRVETERVNHILGTDISISSMKKMLEKLKFTVNKTERGILKVIPPSYRNDVSIEADIIEEIARMYGYNNIPTTSPESKQPGKKNKKQKLEGNVREIMKASGLNELFTFSLMDERPYDILNIPGNSELRNWVKIKNPLNEAFSLLRTSLLPGLIEVLSGNAKRQIDTMKIFELGTVFFNSGKNNRPVEKQMLGGGSMGYKKDPYNTDAPDFYFLKGVLENLFSRLNLQNIDFIPVKKPYFHPGRSAALKYKNDTIGEIGELLPEIIEEYVLPERTALFQVNFADILKKVKFTDFKYVRLAKFPAVTRDLAVVVGEDILAGDILAEISRSGGNLLKEVNLFDLYQGSQIPEGDKSLAFKLLFQADDRTLTDKEINKHFEGIISALKEKFAAEIRGN